MNISNNTNGILANAGNGMVSVRRLKTGKKLRNSGIHCSLLNWVSIKIAGVVIVGLKLIEFRRIQLKRRY